MRSCSRALCLAFLLAAAAFLVPPGAGAVAASPDWRIKVDPWVLEQVGPNRPAEFLVFLAEQADVSAARAFGGKEARGRFVSTQLVATARRTQGPILAELAAAGVEHRAYWIANMIWVRGDLRLVERLARRADVAGVHANPAVALASPVERRPGESGAPQGIEPNISHTGANTVFWNAGYTGQGVVVGGQDTGYDWDHPALKNHYRGWNGAVADHNYHWHDSIHSGGGVCGRDSKVPCDDNGHGTHTMGTMAGDDGGGNQIGMAPGAKWVGCRNMDQGVGKPSTYSECFEWFMAPTDLNGQNPDPSQAPHVINNSWGCPPSEGCTSPNVLKTVIDNTRAAGIVVVASAGNYGSGCSTVLDPPAIYDASFSVGSTNNADSISGFSSRGPVTADGSNRLKPDISAPGENVRSSWPGTGYTSLSGTSMAGPHVVGLVALILSAAPCMAGDVDGIEALVRDSALPRTSSQTCGGVPGSDIPNNTYGYGAIRSQLPAGACQLALTGTATGIDASQAGCRDFTTGAQVAIPLAGNAAWDCTAAGLTALPDDLVGQAVLGTATGGNVGGAVTGMTGTTASCRNRSTGQTVDIPLAGATSWDCTAAGLVATAGDRLLQLVQGDAQ